MYFSGSLYGGRSFGNCPRFKFIGDGGKEGD
jgi:hypothetical protein